jgi:hypothetical protein
MGRRTEDKKIEKVYNTGAGKKEEGRRMEQKKKDKGHTAMEGKRKGRRSTPMMWNRRGVVGSLERGSSEVFYWEFVCFSRRPFIFSHRRF